MLFGSADFVVVVAIKSNRTGEMVGISSLILDSFVIPLQEILSYEGNLKVCSALSPSDSVQDASILAAVLLPCLPTWHLATPTCFEMYYSQSTNAEISRQLIISYGEVR